MLTVEARNIAAVRKYFDGCNSGDPDALLSALAPDRVHSFLPAKVPTIRREENIARYWRRHRQSVNPLWAIDHITAQVDEVVSEWSCIWTNPSTRKRLMARGSEWYLMRDARILELRAYFTVNPDSSVELATFPYAERGYLMMKGS